MINTFSEKISRKKNSPYRTFQMDFTTMDFIDKIIAAYDNVTFT